MRTSLGIIAGSGSFPKILVQACRASGRGYFVLGLEGHADPAIVDAEPHGWIRLGEWSRGVGLLREAGVGDLVMAGPVRRPGLAEIRPDLGGAKVLARLAKSWLGDDTLLSAVARELEREGFRIVSPGELLEGHLATGGPYGAHRPDETASQDIDRGLDVVRAVGALDVGQAAVVQQSVVLGVEAVEGTDALIKRCAALQRPGAGAVLVKGPKPGQDRRFDLPAIGADTAAAAVEAKFAGIAVVAGGAFVFDRDYLVRIADGGGLFVVGV